MHSIEAGLPSFALQNRGQSQSHRKSRYYYGYYYCYLVCSLIYRQVLQMGTNYVGRQYEELQL